MATDEAKKLNALRMTTLSLEVLAEEVWESLGETSMALSRGMGDALLEMFEKEEGLEIGGEDKVAIAKEINRLLVDEFGYAQEITLEVDDKANADFKVKGCINTAFTDKLLKAGVKIPFICPIMLVTSAAMRRMGLKGHVNIERWPDGKGCIIHYTPV